MQLIHEVTPPRIPSGKNIPIRISDCMTINDQRIYIIGIYQSTLDYIIYMKTDERIDTWIVRALTEKATLHYMGLFEYIRKSYRHISLDTFNSHIKKMLSKEYIGKNDTGERGKKVYYFLTEKTKQMERLKILDFKSKKEIAELNNQSEEEKRLSAYIVIFFLGLDYDYPLKTEEELKKFFIGSRCVRK